MLTMKFLMVILALSAVFGLVLTDRQILLSSLKMNLTKVYTKTQNQFSKTSLFVPSQFASGGWSVADDGTGGDITITISALPSDGGSAITDIEYQIDGGTWTSLGGTTPAASTASGSIGASGPRSRPGVSRLAARSEPSEG